MKLPTLLLTLLSTAAIAGSYDDLIVRPACYRGAEPIYMSDYCTTPAPTPAYYPARGADLIANRPAPAFDYGKPDQPFANPYPTTTSSQPDGGLYLFSYYRNGNYDITAPDGGLTVCSSTSCFTP